MVEKRQTYDHDSPNRTCKALVFVLRPHLNFRLDDVERMGSDSS